jgi:hypothetical protein
VRRPQTRHGLPCHGLRPRCPPIREQTCAAARTSGLEAQKNQDDRHNPGAQHQESHCSNANQHWFHCAEARHARKPLSVDLGLNRNHVENVVRRKAFSCAARFRTGERAMPDMSQSNRRPRTVGTYYSVAPRCGSACRCRPQRSGVRWQISPCRPCRKLVGEHVAGILQPYANAYSIEPSFVCSQLLRTALCGAGLFAWSKF